MPNVTFDLDAEYHWYRWYICATCKEEYKRRGWNKKKPWRRHGKFFCSQKCVCNYWKTKEKEETLKQT